MHPDFISYSYTYNMTKLYTMILWGILKEYTYRKNERDRVYIQ
jgi:hypothetical protein